MEISRNQYFLAGLVVFLLGIQFRTIDRIDLTPEFTQFLADRTGHPLAAVSATPHALVPNERPILKKTITPPEFLGWMLISAGIVLILHSWAMPRPS